MNLRNNIDEDYKKAIKNKEQDKTNTLRLIKSAIKDKDISSRSNESREGISDQEILSLLISLIKQRKDSIEQFQNYQSYPLKELSHTHMELNLDN